MSGKQSGMVWDLELLDSAGVSKEAKKNVLLAMADHADHECKNVFPSVGLVAWKTDLSSWQVVRDIKSLVADGLIKLEDENFGKYHTRNYSLTLEMGKKKNPYLNRDNPLTSRCHGGTDIQVSPTPDIQVSPKPSITKDDPSLSETLVSEYYLNGKAVDVSIPPKGDKVNYEQRLELALNPKEKEDKSISIDTPLFRYLQTMSKSYGNKNAFWKGFQSAEERDDWLEMEKKWLYNQIEDTIKWAVSNHFPKKTLARKVIVAINNNPRVKAKNTREIGKAVKSEDGGMYV